MSRPERLSEPLSLLQVRTEDKRKHWEKVDSMSRKWLYSLLGVPLIAGLAMFPLAAFGKVDNNTALCVLGSLGLSIAAIVVFSNHTKLISDRVGTPWVKESIAHWRNVFRSHHC